MKKLIIISLTLVCILNLGAQNLSNGLVGYWTFDGNVDDQSGNNNQGIVHGATFTNDRFGNPNSACNFNGIDNYISVANSGSLQVSHNVTISAWVKIDRHDSCVILVKGNYGILWDYGLSSYWSYPSYESSGNSMVIDEYRNKSDKYNQWHHFVATIDENNGNQLKLFIDGQEMLGTLNRYDKSSNTDDYIRPTSGDLLIGTNSNLFYKGIIDDVRIYNRTLRPGEIDSLYQYELGINQIPLYGLIGYWPFNGNANDQSGNGLNGIVTDAILSMDRFNRPSQAYYFDGSKKSCVISIPDNNLLDLTNSFSLCAWYKSDDTINGSQGILGKGRPDGGSGYRLGFAPKDFYGDFGLNDNSKNLVIGTPDKKYSQNWHFIVGTYDGTKAILYLDGDTITSKTDSLSLLNSSQPLLFGHETPVFSDRYFGGWIDDIRIYNRPLNANEVTSLYNENKSFVTIYDTIPIYDTTFVTVYDSISVTDTLIIDVSITALSSPNNTNSIKVFPNPTKDLVIINSGTNYQSISDYSVKIFNSSGVVVFESFLNEPQFEINIKDFGSTGLYFIQIIDNNQKIIDIRKILLE